MYEKWVEVAYAPLLLVIRREGKVVIIGLIEKRREATEKGCHSKINRAMTVIYCGVYKNRLGRSVAHEVAAPEVAMEERGFLFGEDEGKSSIYLLQLRDVLTGEELFTEAFFGEGLKALVNEEVYP